MNETNECQSEFQDNLVRQRKEKQTDKTVLHEATGWRVDWSCRWRLSHWTSPAGSKGHSLPGLEGTCGALDVPLKKMSRNPQTNPDVPLFSPALFWQLFPGPMVLDVFAVSIVIVGDTQGLFLTCLPEVPAEL